MAGSQMGHNGAQQSRHVVVGKVCGVRTHCRRMFHAIDGRAEAEVALQFNTNRRPVAPAQGAAAISKLFRLTPDFAAPLPHLDL